MWITRGMPSISNKGFSGLISPIGEILNVTNIGKTTYLDVKIPEKLETTVYREYGNLLAYFLKKSLTSSNFILFTISISLSGSRF